MHKKIRDSRVKNLQKQQQKMMEKEGFVIHSVIGESTHTHGLQESFSHPEIECVLPMDPQILMALVSDLSQRVKKGIKISDGEMITDLIQDFAVKMVESPAGLRLILPDPKGSLDRDEMEPEYAAQYDGLLVERSLRLVY